MFIHTSNSRIRAVDGKACNFDFSFAEFLKLWLKFAIHLDGNPTLGKEHFRGKYALEFHKGQCLKHPNNPQHF